MDTASIITNISKEDFDLDGFVRAAINDEVVRGEIVHQMIHHPHIMVYYHCYYVVDEASQKQPDLFYPYWSSLVPLLDHANSYHRNFGLAVLANLCAVDVEDRFAPVALTYFSHLHDAKFMTGQCCVQHTSKILRSKQALKDQTIRRLLDFETSNPYSASQKALLLADILDVFEAVYDGIPYKNEVDDFIRLAEKCASPKTRKKARELIRRYQL